jgi:hypothetical protein
MKLVVFGYYLSNELLYVCCLLEDYELHEENTPYIENVTKGISDDQEEAIEDFCVNMFLSYGNDIVVDYNAIEFKSMPTN